MAKASAGRARIDPAAWSTAALFVLWLLTALGVAGGVLHPPMPKADGSGHEGDGLPLLHAFVGAALIASGIAWAYRRPLFAGLPASFARFAGWATLIFLAARIEMDVRPSGGRSLSFDAWIVAIVPLFPALAASLVFDALLTLSAALSPYARSVHRRTAFPYGPARGAAIASWSTYTWFAIGAFRDFPIHTPDSQAYLTDSIAPLFVLAAPVLLVLLFVWVIAAGFRALRGI